MKVYTYSEARQQLATVLEEAGREGGVRIRRKDGQVFLLQPERRKTSPLDVPVLGLKLTRKEIVEFVHAGRKPVGRAIKGLQPSASGAKGSAGSKGISRSRRLKP